MAVSDEDIDKAFAAISDETLQAINNAACDYAELWGMTLAEDSSEQWKMKVMVNPSTGRLDSFLIVNSADVVDFISTVLILQKGLVPNNKIKPV